MKWSRDQDFTLTSFKETFNEFEGEKPKSCEGYLYIQSRSLWRFPNHLWKRRYFTLRNDCLYFTKEKGDLIFSDSTHKIEIEADTGIYPEDHTKGKSKFLIRITQGKQNYVLCSGDETDRNTWLASLLTVITQKFVVNFKAGCYKSIRLNYKPRPKVTQRHSSFVPKRVTDEDRQNEFSRKLASGSMILNKAESLFNLSTSHKDSTYYERTSFVALI